MERKAHLTARRILAIDAGTTESGYCFMDTETYKPLTFGKIGNDELLTLVREGCYDALVFEAFASYGMSIGASTITSIEWNGRFIEAADALGKPFYRIYRREEKLCLCGSMKAKDANIRQALIDRFARTANGKGTKADPDWFYGFSADAWSGAAIAATWIDKQKGVWEE